MKKLLNKLNTAENARINFEGKCDMVLEDLLKHFDFEIQPYFSFYVEHQASDGMVLADSDSNVYDVYGLIRHIGINGKITDFNDLFKFRI